jgi:hypothetical protein
MLVFLTSFYLIWDDRRSHVDESETLPKSKSFGKYAKQNLGHKSINQLNLSLDI